MTAEQQPAKPPRIRIVCISDTHGHATGEGFKLPVGDVLIHAGDLTNQGGLQELSKTARWLEQAEFDHIVIIAGNHDLSLDANYHLKHAEGWRVEPSATDECRQLMRNIPGVSYLEHESCTLKVKGRMVRVFGSPYSVDNGKQNWAFQYDPADADKIWSSVPDAVDILVTHTPPAGVQDESSHWKSGGCPALLKTIARVQPLLHVFGHHHEGRGACLLEWHEQASTVMSWTDPGAGNRKQSLLDLTGICCEQRRVTAAVNASIMRKSWSRSTAKEFNKPIVVDITGDAFACD